MRKVRIAFGSNVLLEDVNLSLVSGDVCVLTGPNGSGKTSLLRVALKLAPIAAGEIRSTFERPAYVPQFQSVDRQFPCSLRDVLRMSFAGVSYAWRSAARDTRVDSLLEQVGLEHRRDQQLRDCSGGEIQRAMIARALVGSPDFLVLDEPTASLDAAGQRLFFDLLQRLRDAAGLTILTVTHEPEAWRDLATRRMSLDSGGRLFNADANGNAHD
ncbi:MAG: ATP-binding cassette domain-containing protein [Leptospirales bacterium]